MMESLINRLFRCSHKRVTRPMTLPSKPGGTGGQSYVVCLDCGGQFAYDWEQMRVGERLGTPGREGKSRLSRWLRREDQPEPERKS